MNLEWGPLREKLPDHQLAENQILVFSSQERKKKRIKTNLYLNL